MITIIPVYSTDNPTELTDFFRSIVAQSSSKDVYEIVIKDTPKEQIDMFFDQIEFVETPSEDSRIHISLPDNCIVLGKDWDRYVNYMLDSNKVIDNEFIKRRMSLIARPDNGVFPVLSVKVIATR